MVIEEKVIEIKEYIDSSNHTSQLLINAIEIIEEQQKEIRLLKNKYKVKDKIEKQCKFCGNSFIPRKSDAEFCPHEIPGKRSNCMNSYSVMVHRAKKWFDQGLTIDEIQSKMRKKRTKEEIINWVK